MQLTIKDLYTFEGKINRGTYLIWGIILFTIKYLLDRTISAVFFNRTWFITDYFIQTSRISILQLSEADIYFYTTLSLLSLPFIFSGTLLCIKRLRDIGLSPWLVIFFFILGLNFVLFLVLSAIPSKTSENVVSQNDWLGNLIPQNRWGNVALTLGVLLLVALLFSIFSINVLGEYGWGLFLGIPFFLGFGSVLFYNYHTPRSLAESIGIATTSVFAFGLLIIVLAMEGLICVFMASPIALLLAWIGGILAYSIQRVNREGATGMMWALFVLIPLFSYFETWTEGKSPILEVKTSVEINASAEVVWDKLINFSPIDEPKELLFQSGIAYPVKAKIEGKGVGAVRYCVFNTGEFVEPIEVWNKPHHLQFSVKAQPEPMKELSPYRDLDVPHLHGYFKSVKGQFKLIQISPNKTRLEGTTWYYMQIFPVPYWQIWTDYILHSIHRRVLNHIKKDAEK